MLVEHANKPSVEELIARIRARKRATRGGLESDKILKYRDMDRR